jgi:hypothetical protein
VVGGIIAPDQTPRSQAETPQFDHQTFYDCCVFMSKENLKAACSAGVSAKSAGEIGVTSAEVVFPELPLRRLTPGLAVSTPAAAERAQGRSETGRGRDRGGRRSRRAHPARRVVAAGMMVRLFAPRWRPRSQAVLAFDLLELDGEDLRRLPIEVRNAGLAQLPRNPHPGIALNTHYVGDGEIVY